MSPTPEDALLAYLYPRLVEAIQTCKSFDDIYGIWICMGLFQDDPDRPYIDGIGCLRTSTATQEKMESYGDSWAPELTLEDTLSFSPSLCQDDWMADETWGDQDALAELAGDPEGVRLRNAFFEASPTNQDKLQLFLGICGTLIQHLHQNNTLIEICGKSVPVGIWITNDVDKALALEAVRDNNPDRLSKEMEEWMLGTTYEQIARDEAFLAEVRSWPLEKQAHFWCEAMRGDRREILAYVDKKEPVGAVTTPEWEWAKTYGIRTIRPDWEAPVTLALAERLVSEAERYLTLQRTQEISPEQDFAESLIGEFEVLKNRPELQEQVAEETISRLHALLQRLYDESKNEERIGVALQLTARALHALRPERFPVVKFGGRRENANRLLEPERFGLV
jgi:hypothetical protein